jgi:hypothetical protein
MRRVILLEHTGGGAQNLKVAARIVRKIEGAQRQGECLLVDCENVEVSPEFLALLVAAAQPDKIRFCGLPLLQQRFVVLRQRRRKS